MYIRIYIYVYLYVIIHIIIDIYIYVYMYEYINIYLYICTYTSTSTSTSTSTNTSMVCGGTRAAFRIRRTPALAGEQGVRGPTLTFRVDKEPLLKVPLGSAHSANRNPLVSHTVVIFVKNA